MFVGNLQGIYERPSSVETLKTIKQKHDESLQNYVKHFCNARNATLYIEDIEIINTFPNGLSDIKIVKEINMKKPRTVADLLAVTDVCIAASEAYARLLESCGKGPSKKNRTIKKLTQLTREITKITEITDITRTANNSLWIRKRRGLSVALMMQRSDARSVVPRDTI
jgi:hypothetical protein